MCTVAGVYWFADQRPPLARLEEQVGDALATLRNRGPDESSVAAVGAHCVMGGNRLIIRGAPGRGAMPFVSRRCTAYYNGEIYNYARWNAGATSDGEVLVPLYEACGLEAFGQLDGEFAIALWDDDQQRLLLARDQFGTKPLYFSLNQDRLLWASSASAINAMEAHPFCAAVKSSVYTSTYAVQEPYTSFAGIWNLPPGHLLSVSPQGVSLSAYHLWEDATQDCTDPTAVFAALETSLTSRMDFQGTIGIPLSGGVDSGIMAFMANKLGIDFHIFSVVEMFGQPTDETPYILERIARLSNARDVTLLRCNRDEYELALAEMYAPDYYDSEKFDGGSICMHTVFTAMRKAGIRVALDGTGGDELFHGYKFRENFQPVAGWPQPWRTRPYFYSLFTSLLDYTAKSDRAGAHFSIECRYPFQSVALMQAAMTMRISPVLKWPLRAFLLERVDYGPPLDADRDKKFGFSLENIDPQRIIRDMQQAWCRRNGLRDLPAQPPRPFPFQIGQPAALL